MACHAEMRYQEWGWNGASRAPARSAAHKRGTKYEEPTFKTAPPAERPPVTKPNQLTAGSSLTWGCTEGASGEEAGWYKIVPADGVALPCAAGRSPATTAAAAPDAVVRASGDVVVTAVACSSGCAGLDAGIVTQVGPSPTLPPLFSQPALYAAVSRPSQCAAGS